MSGDQLGADTLGGRELSEQQRTERQLSGGQLNGRFPSALTILPTYQCTAACENCCFGCTPRVEGRIPQDRLLHYIREARKIPSLRLIVFSGGECFLLGDDLDEAIAEASGEHIITRCVSNGSWAETPAIARDRVRALASRGLDELNISTGDFHQRWVDIERVGYAAEAAVVEGLQTVVMVEIHEGRKFDGTALVDTASVKRIYANPELARRFQIVESPWMSNKSEAAVAQPADRLISRTNLNASGGCTSVLSSIVISPSEYLIACCGLAHEQIPAMRLGSLRSISFAQLIEQARADFLKQWILIEGPHKILEWAAEKDPSIEWEDKYAHICDACRRLHSDERVMKVVARHGEAKATDVMLRFNMFDRFGPQLPPVAESCGRGHG